VDKRITAAIIVGIVITGFTAYYFLDFTSTEGSISELERYSSYFQTSTSELDRDNPIKIGILHSLSGTKAIAFFMR